jgi:hypothetical protein
MTRAILGVLFATAMAHAQVVISTGNGIGEVATGTLYDFGRIAQGDTRDVRFHLRNTGALPLAICSASTTTGQGFSITDRLSLPFIIPVGGMQDVTVHFAAGAPGVYSAAFLSKSTYMGGCKEQVNTTSVLLQATSVVPPVVTVLSGCTFPKPDTIDFGRAPAGQPSRCDFTLSNETSQPMTVAAFAVTEKEDVFQGTSGVHPLTIAAGGATSFSVTFTPPEAAVYRGALQVDTRSYTLTGTGFDEPLGKPSVQFDRPPASAQPTRMSVVLPSPASAAASGFITLSFHPDSKAATDDPAVLFVATGGRSIPYSVAKGETQVLLNGQVSTPLQTGTTAGLLQFSFSAPAQGFAGDPSSSVAIPPEPVFLDHASAARRPGFLDLHVYGYDNTLSAGAVSFTIADGSGATVDGGSQSADFSTDFRSYFTRAQAGGAFHMVVTFPVSGDASALGSIRVSMANSTGKAAEASATIR